MSVSVGQTSSLTFRNADWDKFRNPHKIMYDIFMLQYDCSFHVQTRLLGQPMSP